MSVNSELQNLLTKMGGTPLDSDTNSDLIKKISDAYDGSGGGSSGGGNVLVVHILTNENNKKYMDKPAGQIYNALENGVVSVSVDNGDGSKNIEFVNSYGGNEEQHLYMIDMNGSYDSPFFAYSESDYPVEGLEPPSPK